MSETETETAPEAAETNLDEDDRLRPIFVERVMERVAAGDAEGARELVAGVLVGDVDDGLEAPLGTEQRERVLEVYSRITGAEVERMRLGGREAGLELPVDEETPDLLERHDADEILDVVTAVAEGAALFVGLGDLRGEGDDTFKTGLNFTHSGSPFGHLGSRWRFHCLSLGMFSAS